MFWLIVSWWYASLPARVTLHTMLGEPLGLGRLMPESSTNPMLRKSFLRQPILVCATPVAAARAKSVAPSSPARTRAARASFLCSDQCSFSVPASREVSGSECRAVGRLRGGCNGSYVSWSWFIDLYSENLFPTYPRLTVRAVRLSHCWRCLSRSVEI
jgi:hypothetical protein